MSVLSLSSFCLPTVSASNISNEDDFVPTIKINKIFQTGSDSVDVKNMLPGDSIIHNYDVDVTIDSDVKVKFDIGFKSGNEKLGDVLNVKVVLKNNDDILYDGLLNEMPDELSVPLKTTKKSSTTLNYEITTSMDKTVGNEYAAQELKLTTVWWIDDSDNVKTGDASNVEFWVITMGVSAVGLVSILSLKKRVKKGDCV